MLDFFNSQSTPDQGGQDIADASAQRANLPHPRPSDFKSDWLKLFRDLVDQSNDIFQVIDPETGRFLDVNEAGPASTGYTRDEYLRLRVCDLDPNVTEEMFLKRARDLQSLGPLRIESHHRRKDGSVFPIEINVRYVRIDRDYIVAVVRDITERTRAEERIREQASMLDRAHDAIIVRDIHTRKITYWNQGAERIYGWTASEAIGRDVGELIFLDPSLLDFITENLLQTGETHGEYKHRSKEGKELIVGSHITLLRDSNGRPQSALVINIDITEQKNLEARFLRAQRMESIGRLATGLAHDLNNILAPIRMSVAMLRGGLPANQAEELLSIIQLSADRGTEIINQVLTFGRGVEGEQRPLSVEDLCGEIVKMVSETFPKNIAIESSLAPDLWTVIGDSTQIHQVLLNLCVNARDAMPEGGTLRLAASNFEVDATFASMLPEASPGTFVLLEVIDTGHGIPSEIAEHIFDPFFTTKGSGIGTGLGLSTALGIVKSHRGFIHLKTQPHRGTTFQVYLPATPNLNSQQTIPPDAVIPSARGELILIVDDEDNVREVARLILERAGYRVLLASDGTEGLAAFATHSSEIAAVITDLLMPFMDGIAFVRAIRALEPALPIIASTGLGQRTQHAELKSLDVGVVLQKPYGAEVLLQALSEAINSDSVGGL